MLRDHFVRFVPVGHLADRFKMLVRKRRFEVRHHVGLDVSSDVRTDRHRSAHLEESCQVSRLEGFEQRSLVVASEKSRLPSLRGSYELFHDLCRMLALVDVVAQIHDVRLTESGECGSEAPESFQISMDVAYEGCLVAHSKIFSTSA